MQIDIALDVRSGVAEGPFWDADDGTLWWVDITGKEVLRWRPGSEAPRRWPMPDFPSAVVLRRGSGALVALRDGLYFMELESGRLGLFCRPEPERPDNRANEGKCDALGRFWLGTMQNNLRPDGSGMEMTASTGALYCVGPDGSSTREVDGVGLSNTIAWSPDGATLYFGDTLANVIWAFDCDLASGRLANRRVFSDGNDGKLPGVCDGSAIDADGHLWNVRFAGGAVVRFAPDGRVERIVELPVSNPTSCCFGGAGLKTLYVTSARFALSEEQLVKNPQEGAILALHPGVRGTPSHRFAG
jgi:sugar lactone lactonase YvrE